MLMDLGIKGLSQGLQSIALGRLYTVCCADELLATRLVAHYLASISANNMLRFLVTQLEAEVFAKNCPLKLLDKIKAHVYSIDEPKYLVSSIPSELRFIKKLPSNAVAVILLDVRGLKDLEARTLSRFLKKLYHCCCSKNSAVVLIGYGQEHETLALSLLEHNAFLSGVSCLSYKSGHPYLEVMLWREDGRFAKDRALLLLNDQGFARLDVNNAEAHSSNDKHTCYLKQDLLDIDRSIYDRILRFESNDEIFKAALDNATAASVVLCLESRNEIEKIARMVYDLRYARGSSLHIFILEMVGGIRASTIHLLSSCGADFIFDANAKASYINAVLPIFLCTKYHGFLTKSFDDLCMAYRAFDDESKGVLSFNDFAVKVSSLLENTQYLKGGGTLVKLKPKESFTLEHCLNIFKPKRGGDFATVRGVYLLVFLSSCRGIELLKALRNVFVVDPLSVFAYSRVYLTADDIKALLKDREEGGAEKNYDGHSKPSGEDLLYGKVLEEQEIQQAQTISTQGISAYITTNSEIKAVRATASHLFREK